MLHFQEKEAWHKTPYQILKLFRYHKEYNPHIFRQKEQNRDAVENVGMDDIDMALGGL